MAQTDKTPRQGTRTAQERPNAPGGDEPLARARRVADEAQERDRQRARRCAYCASDRVQPGSECLTSDAAKACGEYQRNVATRALDPERAAPAGTSLDGGYDAAPDQRPPFATAATSHLERPANPRPPMPSTQGLWGTGAVTALEALDSAMDARSVLAAQGVRTERLPPAAGQFKAAVLEWMSKEGL